MLKMGYPVEAAIKDALYYHGQCSVIAGFQEASDSLKYANDPGVDASIKALAKIKAANLMMHGDEKSPEAILATASKITSSASSILIAGSVLGVSTMSEATFGDFLSVVIDIQHSNAMLKIAMDEMTVTAAERKLPLDSLGLDKPGKSSQPQRTQSSQSKTKRL